MYHILYTLYIYIYRYDCSVHCPGTSRISGGAVPDDADALGDATAVDGIAAGGWS